MDVSRLVREGLTAPHKRLPPVLFYDGAGSELFEEITRTPEYYLTRTEASIFETHAGEILERAMGEGPLEIVELGAGSAHKTRILLRDLVGSQGKVRYVPIDVSADAILPQAEALEQEIPGLKVRPIVGDNAAGLRGLREDGPTRLILFIGSSLGNFEPKEAVRFLRSLADGLRPEDSILLGTDLVKDPATLDAAYNDAAGYTAKFNVNALARLNAEFGANFDLGAFVHNAFFQPTKSRVEMHLVSLRQQTVTIPKLDLTISLSTGESIHTENSYKYTIAGVGELAAEAGLKVDATWTDPKGWFGVHLLRGRVQ